MMPQPSRLQLVERHGLEALSRRRADFQLRTNLRGHLLRRVFVRSDTRPTATAIFRIGQISNLASQIASYFPNTKRTLFDSHDLAFQRVPLHKHCHKMEALKALQKRKSP